MAYTLQGSTGPWEVVVGLEVHAQVVSNAKLFSGAATAFGAEPNSQVSFVDAAFPGMLPVLNQECVAQAVRTGLGLNARINTVSRFDRKNYFYADLPSGYQISQYEHPIVGTGVVEVELADGSTKSIGITRLHLEQDAGKSIHDQHPAKSLIDLNRAGVALMEIVSDPDIRSPEEAGAYVRKLRSILRYLGTCDGNMEEGSMRADVNVSVRKHGEPYRTRCEVKNVNSIRFVMQAGEAEATRQVEVWESGGTVVQETRLFDSGRGVTRSMRSKEDAHDYRYFPDPDLMPLVIDAAWIERVKSGMTELPVAIQQRFVTQYDANVLTSSKAMAAYYEAVVVKVGPANAKVAANWLMGEVSSQLNREGLNIAESPVSSAQLALLLQRIADGTISNKIAKEIFLAIWEEKATDEAAADRIIEAKGLKQISDTGELEAIIDEVLAANEKSVEEFRAGKEKAFNALIGQAMKATKGKANPAQVNELLKKKLS